jgi:hypothetical protein
MIPCGETHAALRRRRFFFFSFSLSARSSWLLRSLLPLLVEVPQPLLAAPRSTERPSYQTVDQSTTNVRALPAPKSNGFLWRTAEAAGWRLPWLRPKISPPVDVHRHPARGPRLAARRAWTCRPGPPGVAVVSLTTTSHRLRGWFMRGPPDRAVFVVRGQDGRSGPGRQHQPARYPRRRTPAATAAWAAPESAVRWA